MLPTDEQAQQAVLVHHDTSELIARLSREGVDARIIMAGLAAATSELVANAFGPSEVGGWFDRQAAMARQILG